MQTTNFYAFKSSLLGKPLIDDQNLNGVQRDVFAYYKRMSENMTMNLYREYFRAWFEIIGKTMKVSKNKNDVFSIECNCKYKFGYKVKSDDFALTCEGNHQNIVDVICDHAQCIINDNAFIENTIMLKNFNENILNRVGMRQVFHDTVPESKSPRNK